MKRSDYTDIPPSPFQAALSNAQLSELERTLANQPRDHVGVRLSGIPELRPILSPTGPIGNVAGSVLGPECLPVRAILFDKNADQNWSLGWHQDRTIAVRQRTDVVGFGPWSVKTGMIHVEPPFDLLTRMVTVRVHLDAVPETNAPLLVAPRSHKRGRIPTAEIPEVVRQCGVITCLAASGDALRDAYTGSSNRSNMLQRRNGSRTSMICGRELSIERKPGMWPRKTSMNSRDG